MPLLVSPEPLIKVTLNLFKADVDRLRELQPRNHTTYLRNLLRAHLNRLTIALERSGGDLSGEIDDSILDGMEIITSQEEPTVGTVSIIPVREVEENSFFEEDLVLDENLVSEIDL